MDTRKVTLIATVAIIALVAVGIGYAYTATTENGNNTLTSEYIQLSQGGAGAYTFTTTNEKVVVYDTVNTASGTTIYSLSDNKSTTILKDYTLVKVGKQFTISATQVGADAAARVCEVSFKDDAKVDLKTNWVLLFKVVNGSTTTWLKFDSNKAWQKAANPAEGISPSFSSTDGYKYSMGVTAGDSPTYNNTTIDVYYGYLTTNEDSLTTAPNEKVLDGATLEFKVTVDKTNRIADS